MDEQTQNQKLAGGSQLTDAAVISEIKNAICSAQSVYANYAYPLTEIQRKHLIRTGLKNHGFVEEVARIVAENQSLIPVYIGTDRFMADYTDYKSRRDLYSDSCKLMRALDDGLTVASDTFFHDALSVYEYVKEGARRGDPACKTAYDVLKARFEEQGRRKNNDSSELEG